MCTFFAFFASSDCRRRYIRYRDNIGYPRYGESYNIGDNQYSSKNLLYCPINRFLESVPFPSRVLLAAGLSGGKDSAWASGGPGGDVSSRGAESVMRGRLGWCGVRWLFQGCAELTTQQRHAARLVATATSCWGDCVAGVAQRPEEQSRTGGCQSSNDEDQPQCPGLCHSSNPNARSLSHSPSGPPPSFTQSPYPPCSLVRDGQPHPHRPRLVVSHSTCPPLSSSPPANSFVTGPAVINTHTYTCAAGSQLPGTLQTKHVFSG